MGYSNSSSNGGTSEQVKNNNAEIINDFIDLFDEETQGKLKAIVDYCDENGIMLNDTRYESYEIDGEGRALLSFTDPETGKEINIFNSYLEYENAGTIGAHLKEITKNLAELPDIYTVDTRRVNLVNEDNAFGYFWQWYPTSIQVCPTVFGSKTGVKGTLIHEMTHLNETFYHGFCGAMKDFSELDSYPTRYASRDHSECISTVVEQVYTKTLRNDAIMKDGTPVAESFQNKYHREAKNESELYNYWHDEWSDLTTKAEQLIKNGFE